MVTPGLVRCFRPGCFPAVLMVLLRHSNQSEIAGMTGSPFPSSPESSPCRPATDARRVGRLHQWATFLFLLGGIALFGLAWLLGYVHSGS